MKWWKTTQQTMGKVLFCLVRHSRVCQTCLWASLTRHKWTLCYWMILVAIEAIVLKEMARVWVETNMKHGTVILIIRRMPLTMIGVRLSLMPLVYRTLRISGTKWFMSRSQKCQNTTWVLPIFLYYCTGDHIGNTKKPICWSVMHSWYSIPVQSIVQWNIGRNTDLPWYQDQPSSICCQYLQGNVHNFVKLSQMRMFHSWVVQLRDVDWYNCRSYQSTLCSIYQDNPVAVSYITPKGFTILINFSSCYTALQSICTKQSRNILANQPGACDTKPLLILTRGLGMRLQIWHFTHKFCCFLRCCNVYMSKTHSNQIAEFGHDWILLLYGRYS